MAKKQEMENVEKEVKKLDNVKNTDENKKAIAESEGKTVDKKESKPAVAKTVKKEKAQESKVELEREYIVPLKRGVLNVKDMTGKGRIVEVPQQTVEVDQPDINISLSLVDYAIGNYDDLENPVRYSLERISEVFPAGKLMEYGFSSYACHPSSIPFSKVMCEIIYSNRLYMV